MSDAPRRKGRPPAGADGERRTERVTVWMSPKEMGDIRARASDAGLSVADYMRNCAGPTPILVEVA